jgi:urease accessory protein
MKGHLELVCSLGGNGLSHLSSQSFRAPMHISKPHLDEGTLVVNVVNPTAGLFEGDEVRCRARVERDARLLLTSPSATRAHGMAGGGEARIAQDFSVAAGGWLEVWPEWFIPQAGARCSQKTRADLEEGSGFLFFEPVAPGRVASGEVFAFASLDWETDIFYAGELAARERYRVTPGDLQAVRKQFPTAYYASVFLFHPALTPQAACWRSIGALHGQDAWVGHSRLHRSGWCVKVLAVDSLCFRKTLLEIRRLAHEAIGFSAPNVRRF